MISESVYRKLDEFFLEKKQRVYKKGEIILEAEINPPSVFYIEKGFIKVYSLDSSGEEKNYVFYKDGVIFPLVLVLKGTPDNLYYEAMSDTIIRETTKESFMQFIHSDKEVLEEVLQMVLDLFGVYLDRVENLELSKAYARVIARLLFIAKRFGRVEGNRVLLDIPITHYDIADSIALTRETTSREIEKLRKKGLITYIDRSVWINDAEKLKDELVASVDKERA